MLLLLLLAACSRDEAPSSPSPARDAGAPARLASCDRVAAMSVCSEYEGAYLAQNELAVTTTCKKLSGAFVYAECPNTALLGSCVLATTERRRFYGSGQAAYTLESAKKECASFRGTWSDH